MGAAAYDGVDDLIVVYGGLQFSTITTPANPFFFVTDGTSRSTATSNTLPLASIPVYEYTPPEHDGRSARRLERLRQMPELTDSDESLRALHGLRLPPQTAHRDWRL